MRVWLILALLAPPLGASPAAKSPLTVVATLHGLHAKSPRYSYATLYSLVKCLQPDYVGVEIRPEDLTRPEPYLEANYPREMIALAAEWKARAFGFDWLGDDVAGAPIPADWWAKGSPVKQLERALDGDRRYQDSLLDSITAREKAILADATPENVNGPLYGDLNDRYYARLAYLLAGSPYQAVPEFYARRDYRLALNVAAFVKGHEGSRIVIVTGADHRGPLSRLLDQWLGESARISPIDPCLGAATKSP
jgi:hypothetical protein